MGGFISRVAEAISSLELPEPTPLPTSSVTLTSTSFLPSPTSSVVSSTSAPTITPTTAIETTTTTTTTTIETAISTTINEITTAITETPTDAIPAANTEGGKGFLQDKTTRIILIVVGSVVLLFFIALVIILRRRRAAKRSTSDPEDDLKNISPFYSSEARKNSEGLGNFDSLSRGQSTNHAFSSGVAGASLPRTHSSISSVSHVEIINDGEIVQDSQIRRRSIEEPRIVYPNIRNPREPSSMGTSSLYTRPVNQFPPPINTSPRALNRMSTDIVSVNPSDPSLSRYYKSIYSGIVTQKEE